MSAIEDARSARAAWDVVEGMDASNYSEAGDRLAKATDALIAEHERLSAQNAGGDEFDALEDLIVEARDEYPRDVRDIPSSELTERILAAGFRRQGPIADAQVNAAFDSWNGMHVGTVRDRLRAALEAARDA